MAEPFLRNSHYTYASNWQGQATYVDLLFLWNRPIDYGPYPSGVRSKASLSNEAPQKGNLFCTKDALRCICIQFIRAHALEHRS